MLLIAGMALLSPVHAQPRKVEVFVASWCPYCRALESFLSMRNIAYKRYDIEHDSEGMRRYQALGAGSIPIIIIDGRMMRGFDPRALMQLLGTKPEIQNGLT